MAFAVGLRFDIAAICRINSPFIVLSVLPFAFVEKHAYQRLLKYIFLLTNVPFLIINVVDYEYHKFTGQRSTLSLLDMGADIPNQIGQLSFHYWYLAGISILFILSALLFFRDAHSSDVAGESEPAGIGAMVPRSFDIDHCRDARVPSAVEADGNDRRLTTALAAVE